MHEEELRALASDLASHLPDRSSRVLQFEVERDNILPLLKKAGFTKLYGASARDDAYDFADYTSVKYMRARFTKTHLPDCFIDCCILLRGPRPDEVGDMLETLSPGGFAAVPADSVQSGGGVADGLTRIGTAGRLALLEKKSAAEPSRGGVSILSYSDAEGGIGGYGRLLATRFSESGVEAEVVRSSADAKNDTVLIEYANGLPEGRSLFKDIELLVAQGRRVIVEIHDTLGRFSQDDRMRMQDRALLVYRANEAAGRDRVVRYSIAPHISYTNVPTLAKREGGGPLIGSFGFAARYKRYPLIVKSARRMGIPLRLMVSINEEVSEAKTTDALGELGKEMGCPIAGPGKYSSSGVEAEVGFFTTAQIAEAMGGCSHILFAHTTSGFHQSGVMTMAKRFSRPLVALNSFQAKQAQAVRVSSFTKSQGIADHTKAFGAALLHRRPKLGEFIGGIAGVIRERSLDSAFLAEHSADLSRDDDGFEYLQTLLRYPS